MSQSDFEIRPGRERSGTVRIPPLQKEIIIKNVSNRQQTMNSDSSPDQVSGFSSSPKKQVSNKVMSMQKEYLAKLSYDKSETLNSILLNKRPTI